MYPEVCNRQRELTWRYPLMCRGPPLLVRRPCGACGTVHNMVLALGLASRLDISVTTAPRTNVQENRPREQCSSLSACQLSAVIECGASSAQPEGSPDWRCLTKAARKPARPGRPLIGEGPRCEVPPHTRGVASEPLTAQADGKRPRPRPEQSKAPTLPLHHLQALARHISPALHSSLGCIHVLDNATGGQPTTPSVLSLNHVSFPRSSSTSASAPGRRWRVRSCPRSFTSGETAWI